jgi:WD40 repeat protein
MDEVFISYSRRDKDFVTRLHGALSSRGRTPWVDWEMEPLERWEQSIRHAIDRSIAVILVLTPEWLASRECAKELQRATEQHKRLLPVLLRKVDDGLVDGSVRSINWIDFSDDRAFDAAVGLVVKGLDEDPEWKRRLAQLATRAVRWDDQGRDVSQTLRGRELRDAEQIMALAAQNEPKPTELQAHYVLASRRAVARRQGITLGAIALGAVIAVSLTIVAYLQSQERARQERIAATRQLVNQAEALRTVAGKPEGLVESVAIGTQAVAAAAALDIETASADESVRRGLDLLPERPTELASRVPESRAVGFDPFGRYLALASSHGGMRVWDLASGRELKVTNTGPALERSQVRAVALAPDARFLAAIAFSAGTSKVIVWRLPETVEVASVSLAGDLNQRVGLSPDGAYVYLSGIGGARAWSVASGMPFDPFPSNVVASAMAFSPGGDRLALAYRTKETRERVVEVLDAKTLSRQARWVETEAVRDVRWTGGGAQLAVIGHDLVSMRDARSGALSYVRRLEEPAFAADDRGSLIVEIRPDHEVVVSDGATGEPYRRLHHPAQVKGLAFGPDDRSIATVAVDGKIRIWKLGHGSAVDELTHGDPIVDARFTGDSVVTRSTSASRRWRLSARGHAPVPVVETPVGETESPPDRLSARIADDPRQVELFSQRGGPVKTLTFEAPVGAVVVGATGRRAGVLLSRDVMTRRLGVRPTLETWDVDRGTRLRSITLGDDISRRDFTYLSSDPDDRVLVTKTDDGFRLWDAETLSPRASVFHADPEQIAFQPKGPLVATSSRDGTIRVWRLEDTTLTEVARMRARSRPTRLTVDAQGRWIAAVREGGRAALWVVRPDELVAQACARISPRCDSR